MCASIHFPIYVLDFKCLLSHSPPSIPLSLSPHWPVYPAFSNACSCRFIKYMIQRVIFKIALNLGFKYVSTILNIYLYNMHRLISPFVCMSFTSLSLSPSLFIFLAIYWICISLSFSLNATLSLSPSPPSPFLLPLSFPPSLPPSLPPTHPPSPSLSLSFSQSLSLSLSISPFLYLSKSLWCTLPKADRLVDLLTIFLNHFDFLLIVHTNMTFSSLLPVHWESIAPSPSRSFPPITPLQHYVSLLTWVVCINRTNNALDSTIILLKYVCLSQLANFRSQF